MGSLTTLSQLWKKIFPDKTEESKQYRLDDNYPANCQVCISPDGQFVVPGVGKVALDEIKDYYSSREGVDSLLQAIKRDIRIAEKSGGRLDEKTLEEVFKKPILNN